MWLDLAASALNAATCVLEAGVTHIAVITTFAEIFEAFSLCRVAASQVDMLRRHGHQVTFVATEGCPSRGAFAHPDIANVRIPYAVLVSEQDALDRPAAFREDVDYIKGKLRPVLATCAVAITHDILLIWHHLAYNVACRELALEFPRVRWLHWIHSAADTNRDYPRGDPRATRFIPFPHAQFVYPNAVDAPRVARQFGVPEHDVRVVPHAMDVAETFDFHPISRALVHRFRLYEPDIFAIYPARLDRGKQAEKIVRLFAELKRAGASVRLLLLNFHSTGEHFIYYRDEILAEAATLGLDGDDVVFTNALRELPPIAPAEMRRAAIEMPHRVVMDLFHLSDIYVHPSASETYSLVCQEAAISGNLLVLNDDFPAMREVYGDEALYVKFSSTLFHTIHTPNENAYYAEVARDILTLLDTYPTLAQRRRIRRTRNPDAVFQQYLQPLLDEILAEVAKAG
jgi:glycosyltransferase involved in cell wall biosynthesis